jgi:PAS domain-containing protein
MPSISDEKKLHHRLKTLSDAFLLSSRVLDYKSFLRTITKHFKVFTEADASVLLLNNNNESLTPVCSVGIPFSKIKDACLPCSMRLKDLITHPVLDLRYTSFMNTPLIHNRKLIGLSAVFSIMPEKFHTFEHDKYESLFLTMLASYIAVSIENVTLINTIKSIERSKFDWESTIDIIEDLISIHDEDFTIVRANKAVAKKFNTDIKAIIGKKCYKVFHGTEEPWKTCPHRKTMETKTPCTEEIEDPHMCGIFTITTFPHFNEIGKCIGSIHVAKDVTEQKKRLEQVLHSEFSENRQVKQLQHL